MNIMSVDEYIESRSLSQDEVKDVYLWAEVFHDDWYGMPMTKYVIVDKADEYFNRD